MEVVASQQHLGDSSFSCGWLKRGAAPSFERLVDAADLLGHSSFGSSRSFIDMDPAELFSMRWTTTTLPAADFDFGVPVPDAAGGDSPSSPMLVSASQVIRDGRLLPYEPARQSVAELPSRSAASSPRYYSAQSTPASLSSCSSTRSTKNAKPPPPPFVAGTRRNRASSWKMLLQYLWFLVPLYRKVRALRRFPSAPRRPQVAPASPARASTSSLEWCHGNADTAVRDAILYCKKSSGQA